MIPTILSRKKGLFVLLFLVSVLSLNVVVAEGESCTSTSDCSSGEVCEDGVCTTYCSIGETECSDGIDNDGDGAYDYWGACFTDSTDTEANDCSAYDFASECEDSCRDFIYYDVDTECRSPLDNDESADPRCADGIDNDGDTYVDYPDDSNCLSPEWDLEEGFRLGAPEEERGFFERLWDWLVFWK